MSERGGLRTVTASIGRRMGAYALDLAIAYLLIAVISGVVGGALLASSGGDAKALAGAVLVVSTIIGALSLAWLIVYTAMQGGRGSIGQRATGVSIRDAATGAPIGFWRALLRNVVWALAGSIVVGYFTPLFDSTGRRQGWHDKASHSVVVTRQSTTAEQAPSPSGRPVVAPALPMSSATTPVPPLAPHPTPTIAPGGVISQVPGSVAVDAPPPPAPPAPTAQPAPAAAAPAAPPAAAAAASTLVSVAQDEPEPDELDQTRAAASLPSSRIPDPAAIIVLTWDNGTRMAVYGRTLYGRNPESEQGAARVAVRDETLSLSKTHFELGGDEAGPWIIDRHSTNGSVLVRGGTPQRLIAGVQTTLRGGDRLEFGDRSALVSTS